MLSRVEFNLKTGVRLVSPTFSSKLDVAFHETKYVNNTQANELFIGL